MTQRFDLRRLFVAALVAVLFVTIHAAPAAGRAQDPEPGATSGAEQAPVPAADPEPADPAYRAQAIVHLDHADPHSVADVIRVFGVHALAHPDLHLVTIHGSKSAVEAARAAAVELDRPQAPTKSIQVLAYVLDASKTDELAGGVPDDLQPVARQLREIFGYRGVELVDTLALRVLDGGSGQVTGTLPASGDRPAMPYRLGFNRAEVIGGENGTAGSVRLDGFQFDARTSGPPSESGESPKDLESLSRLVTDLEAHVGQKAVVGKAATAGARQGLIVVVSISVLD